MAGFFCFCKIFPFKFVSCVCCSLWAPSNRHGNQRCSQFPGLWMCGHVWVDVFLNLFGPFSQSFPHLQAMSSFCERKDVSRRYYVVKHTDRWMERQMGMLGCISTFNLFSIARRYIFKFIRSSLWVMAHRDYSNRRVFSVRDSYYKRILWPIFSIFNANLHIRTATVSAKVEFDRFLILWPGECLQRTFDRRTDLFGDG